MVLGEGVEALVGTPCGAPVVTLVCFNVDAAVKDDIGVMLGEVVVTSVRALVGALIVTLVVTLVGAVVGALVGALVRALV